MGEEDRRPGEGDSGRRARGAGTHPVLERPSVGQRLLPPPAGQSRRGKGADSPAFRSSRPAAFPAQAPVAIGDLGAPSGLAQLSVPLCTSLSLHISNSVHLCPVWGRSQRDSWRGKQKRRETGPPPSRDPHPSDQFSGTSYICLPSLLTWWGMGGRGRCVCAKYISLVGLLKSVTLALPLISAGETEGWGSESGRAGTGAELGRG